MPETHSDFYARWRAQNEAPLFLGERDAAHPPERLLQSIWLHQRLRREELQTLDGQPLRVLHPGFWNRAATNELINQLRREVMGGVFKPGTFSALHLRRQPWPEVPKA